MSRGMMMRWYCEAFSYPSSRLAFNTFCRVDSLTENEGSSLRILDTVACENPVCFAISLIVAIGASPPKPSRPIAFTTLNEFTCNHSMS